MMKVSLVALYFTGAAAQDVFLASAGDTLKSTDLVLDNISEAIEVQNEQSVQGWTCVAGSKSACRHQHGGPQLVWTCPNTGCQCCMPGEYTCQAGVYCQPDEVSTGQQCCSESTTVTTTTQAPTEPDPSYISNSVQCDAVGSRIPRGKDDGSTFRCHGGRCLPMRGRCNGVRNCADGSDEVGCAPTEPDPSYISSSVQCDAVGSRITRGKDNGMTFRCLGGRCLPMRGRCNGVRNCADGSDEVGCTITTTSSTTTSSTTTSITTTSSTTTSSTTTTTTVHHGAIKAVDGSSCLSVYGDSVSAADCNDHADQVWEWQHEGVDALGASFGVLKHVASGRCLDIGVDSCEKGTNLILDECIAHTRTQQFQFMDSYEYQAKWIMAQACVNRPFHRDRCLDIDLASDNKNDHSKKVLLWSCKGVWSDSLNQKMGWAAKWW